MKNLLIATLSLALALTLLVHWLHLKEPAGGSAREAGGEHSDLVQVWVDELIGSPEESYYYELADLWNQTHPGVKVKMTVMAHSGYESKLRIALASGQPPDVCLGGLESLENLRYTGKAEDLAVTIPEEFFPRSRVKELGPVVETLILRDGRPTTFPVYRYSYGGFILANRAMLLEAGCDDEEIRRNGWTFEQFRDACRKITRDTNGDGTPDIWAFGAALVHLNQLFLHEFGPAVWGKEVHRRSLMAWDQAKQRWDVHPALTEEQIRIVFALFDDLINEDKVWNPAYFGMNWNEINEELIGKRRLAMAFGEMPWVPKTRLDMWDLEEKQGVVHENPRPDLTVVWMPTLKAGDRPVPRSGLYGFNVMRQTPYKGDEHTHNAIRVALFITHPVHLVRSQFRRFRHLPADPVRFSRMFPEMVDPADKWVRFYEEVFNSDIPLAEPPLGSETPDLENYLKLRVEFTRWMEKSGITYLQEVIFRRMTPEEGARKFMEDLRALPRSVYSAP